jgi:endonuclease YncB( thermonuclease family)
VLLASASLAVIALLAFALSFVAFLIQTSRHRSSGGWAAAAAASLVLVILCGGIANALQGEGTPSRSEGQANSPNVAGQSDHDATATVTRVVDGDTVEISPPVEGLSTVRLIGVDTPETHGGTQPYGPEASDFTREYLQGAEVALELDVEKIDPYGRLLAYVYLPDGQMFNETLVEEGYAQVATFPPNVKYVDRFLEAQRKQGQRTEVCGGSLPQSFASRPTGTMALVVGARVPSLKLQRRLNRPVLGVGQIATWTVQASKPTRRHRGCSSKTRVTRTTSTVMVMVWRVRS